MNRLMAALMLTAVVMLNGCGYHLVGHGDGEGAIAGDVKTVTLTLSGSSDRQMPALVKRYLASDAYTIIEPKDVVDQASHAVVHVMISPLSFTPSAYDLAGVATQYHMIYSGSLSVVRDGKAVWRSGLIQRQGDVYVTGGPTSIEASRERLLEDLQKQWLQDAAGRLRSGF